MGGSAAQAEDEALVSGIGDRTQGALAEAYRRHGGAVWAVARQVCGDVSLAEQVCAETFTELWSRPERFDPAEGSLRSWLVTQAHARAVAVAGPRPQRAGEDAVLLMYLGGHSCRAAARLLGVSEAEVKRHARHGLLRLRTALDAQEVTR